MRVARRCAGTVAVLAAVVIGPLQAASPAAAAPVVKVPANIVSPDCRPILWEAVVWTVSVLERSCVVVVHPPGTNSREVLGSYSVDELLALIRKHGPLARTPRP